MQSGYSELMGLYPPEPYNLDSGMEISGLASLSMPPFNVRDSTEINKKLGKSPLPHNHTAVPVFNVEKTNIKNLKPGGCQLVEDEYERRKDDHESIEQYRQMVEKARKPIGAALELPQDVI